MGAESFMRSGQHLWVIRKAEIIIRTEIDDRLRFALVINQSTRIRTGKQLGLVKFNRPRPDAHPVCKARWSLQRITAFTRQKVTQTEFCRVLVHHAVHCLSLATAVTDGVSQQNWQFLSFTDSLRSSPLHLFTAEFRVGAANLASFGFRTRF